MKQLMMLMGAAAVGWVLANWKARQRNPKIELAFVTESDIRRIVRNLLQDKEQAMLIAMEARRAVQELKSEESEVLAQKQRIYDCIANNE